MGPVKQADRVTEAGERAPSWPATVEEAYVHALETWNAPGGDDRIPEADRPLRRRQIALLLERVPEGGLVLDLGMGAGIVAHTLLLAGRRVAVLDVPEADPEPAERLRGLGAEVLTAEVGPEPIPLEDGSVDAVFLGDVIEHVPGSPLPMLEEIHRVLRAGGQLVLTTPNAVRLHVRAKLLLGRSNWPPLDVVYGYTVHPSHHREYTGSDLVDVLTRSGFEQIAVEYVEERLVTLPLTGLDDIATIARRTRREVGPARRLVWGTAARAARMLISVRPTLAGDIVVTARRPTAEAPLRRGCGGER